MRRKVFHFFSSQDCKERANEIGNDDIHLTNRHLDDDISNIPRNKRNNSYNDGHNSNDIDDGPAIEVCFP